MRSCGGLETGRSRALGGVVRCPVDWRCTIIKEATQRNARLVGGMNYQGKRAGELRDLLTQEVQPSSYLAESIARNSTERLKV